MRRMSELSKNLQDVLTKIDAACQQVSQFRSKKPRLVAVSKTKPVEAIQEAYNAGQRVFGENYIQELEEKGKSALLIESCPDIKWHFIGRLQSNKVKRLLMVDKLDVIETIASEKLAKEVNTQFEKLNSKTGPLKVMLQVNTSQEEQKGGCEPQVAPSLARYITTECPALELIGVMTIGAFIPVPEGEVNPDFETLLICRKSICKELEWPNAQLEVSMGMSGDFEQAIRMGSTNVRIGSTIFGSRNYSADATTSANAVGDNVAK